MSHPLSFPDVDKAIQQMRLALNQTNDDCVRNALQSGLNVLQTVSNEEQLDLSSRYDGAIERALEDHNSGQFIKVRIFYNWTDYNRADEPFPIWGANVEDVQVVSVSHVEKDGNPTSIHNHILESAWNQIQDEMELVRERCTEDGYHRGLGETPYWYRPYSATAPSSQPEFASRMAASVPTRACENRARRSS